LIKQYAFTKVFPEETTQAEYYASCAAPMVRKNAIARGRVVKEGPETCVSE
jgi:hypothetical protein